MVATTQRRRKGDHWERRSRIIRSARDLAEAGGWDSVTTRRLAESIEYSQPVLYGHFPGGKPEIMKAVALQGFQEIEAAMNAGSGDFAEQLTALADGYLDYATRHPAVYQAMFSLPIDASFATAEAEPEMRAAFGRIVAVLRERPAPIVDLETAAEVLWAALHGLATLQRADRLRPDAVGRRVAALVQMITSGP